MPNRFMSNDLMPNDLMPNDFMLNEVQSFSVHHIVGLLWSIVTIDIGLITRHIPSIFNTELTLTRYQPDIGPTSSTIESDLDPTSGRIIR